MNIFYGSRRIKKNAHKKKMVRKSIPQTDIIWQYFINRKFANDLNTHGLRVKNLILGKIALCFNYCLNCLEKAKQQNEKKSGSKSPFWVPHSHHRQAAPVEDKFTAWLIRLTTNSFANSLSTAGNQIICIFRENQLKNSKTHQS